MAFAADCPVKFGQPDYVIKVEARIAKAKSCDAAYEIASACALGSSVDTTIAGAAVPVCEKGAVLNSIDRAAYAVLKQHCDDKYADQQGTMFISFTAFCHLDAARAISTIYAPVQD